jgi:hypothetical protein
MGKPDKRISENLCLSYSNFKHQFKALAPMSYGKWFCKLKERVDSESCVSKNTNGYQQA